MVKLAEISTAALEAVDYMNELLAELEINEEEERISEIKRIKKKVTDAVKTNEKEVKAEMQRILDEAAQNAPAAAPRQPTTSQEIQQAIADLNLGSEIQQALSNLNLGATSLNSAPPKTGPDFTAKLTLRHGHILEDANDFQKILATVKLASDMTDSEVIFFMRKSESWTKKIEDLVTSNRKFQEEALGNVDLAQMAEQLDEKVKIVKTVKENK